MLIFSIILNFVLLVLFGITVFYLIRFAKIIFSIEDNLSNALDTLNDVSRSLEKLLAMKLFFDSREIKMAVNEAFDLVKLSKNAVTQVINDFTRMSKEKYITVKEEEEKEEDIKNRFIRVSDKKYLETKEKYLMVREDEQEEEE